MSLQLSGKPSSRACHSHFGCLQFAFSLLRALNVLVSMLCTSFEFCLFARPPVKSKESDLHAFALCKDECDSIWSVFA